MRSVNYEPPSLQEFSSRRDKARIIADWLWDNAPVHGIEREMLPVIAMNLPSAHWKQIAEDALKKSQHHAPSELTVWMVLGFLAERSSDLQDEHEVAA